MPLTEYTPTEDETLYAKWEQGLVLYAENDLAVDSWKGGVDLSWQAADAENKVYKLYQKLEGEPKTAYEQLLETNDPLSSVEVSKSYDYTNSTKKYTVQHTGFYKFTADGAQGENHGEYDGGQGGRVEATFWLQKGDVLEISVGGQGGSGGTSPAGNGGDGGLSTSIVEGMPSGSSGAVGGGAGYMGGTAGQYVLHEHTDDCKHTHYGDPTLGTGCYTGGGRCK